MDFQGFVNTFSIPCAVLSVQNAFNGHCGEIRIVKSNDIYREKMGVARYHDGMLYQDLVPKDSKFEDFCYRSAILKKKMHAYIHTRGINAWSDITLIPLDCNESNLSYCAFFFELTREPDAERISNVSVETAHAIIKTALSLNNKENFIDGISEVVSDIQKISDADCSCILTLNRKSKKIKVLYEKIKTPSKYISEIAKSISYELVETWEKTLGKSNCIIIKDEHDMEEMSKINPLWFSNLRQYEVKSVIVNPLLKNNKIIGYIFISNFNTEKLVQLKELIELVSYFVSAAIANHGKIKELETVSTEDTLTGVKNRNAMNMRIDSFVTGSEVLEQPFGVIFADINGLDQVNEDDGHSSGDILLKKAAELLKSIFRQDEIYRSSGAEFVIIVPGCSKEDFTKKLNELKARSCYGSEVCLSIGSDWNDEDQNIRRSMHIADEEMYNEKAKFYMEHQNLERRWNLS